MNKALIFVTTLLFTSNVIAIEDTLSNREIEAERYLQTTPPKAMFDDLAEKVSITLQPENRDKFKLLLTKHLDIDALTRSMKKAMVKNFTADELSALADFYGSKVGRSAMAKFGAYMADVMPDIQSEMYKAQVKAKQELEGNGNR